MWFILSFKDKSLHSNENNISVKNVNSVRTGHATTKKIYIYEGKVEMKLVFCIESSVNSIAKCYEGKLQIFSFNISSLRITIIPV